MARYRRKSDNHEFDWDGVTVDCDGDIVIKDEYGDTYAYDRPDEVELVSTPLGVSVNKTTQTVEVVESVTLTLTYQQAQELDHILRGNTGSLKQIGFGLSSVLAERPWERVGG